MDFYTPITLHHIESPNNTPDLLYYSWFINRVLDRVLFNTIDDRTNNYIKKFDSGLTVGEVYTKEETGGLSSGCNGKVLLVYGVQGVGLSSLTKAIRREDI